jgi:hypothetical protein
MKTASSYVAALACLTLAALAPLREVVAQGGNQAASSPATPSLNYEFFKAKVQPVFLAKRPGHARCVVCHTVNNAPFHLASLSSGSATWNEAQSRQNFELVQRVVVPGYEGSRLLTHPLAERAGGDPHHGGGQQFASQDDPDWSTLKAFVFGATLK